MKEIHLSNTSEVVMVDDADYEWLSQYRWSCNGLGYAQAWVEKRHWFMHRLIMGAKKGQEIDHRNRNKRDNRRDNLRFCTRSENCRNLEPSKRLNRGASQMPNGRWRAYYYVTQGGKKRQIAVGCFGTQQEALDARRAASPN